MSKQEMAKLLGIIYEAYHFFGKDQTPEKAATAVKLWYNVIGSAPYELVEAAIYAHIAKSEYPPTIAHIRKEMEKLTESEEELTEVEAMNLILSAASNSIYNALEEFEKLPPILRKLVGSPGQLRNLATMDVKTINSVVTSNLSRSYKIMVSRQREKNLLPDISRLYLNSTKES